MSTTARVYVDAAPVDVPASARAIDAVRAADAAGAEAVERGARVITDSRGLPIASETPVYAGAIFRLVSARAAARADDVDA